MGDFTMPSLGADMDAGTLTKWLVKPGDEVHRGDIVAVVDTDKSTIEVEIFENGVVEQLVVPEGETVPVGTVLAHVASTTPSRVTHTEAVPAGSAVSAPPLPVAAGNGGKAPAPSAGQGSTPPVYSPLVRRLAQHLGVDLARVPGSGPGGEVTRSDVQRAAKRSTAVESQGRVRASPLARRLAAELGVDLTGVRGTGPGGSVIERDLQAAGATLEPVGGGAPTRIPAEGRPVSGVATETAAPDRQAGLRKAIGALMARSKREIPHYYLSTTIDVGTANAWLEQANLTRTVESRLVLSVLLLKATALAVAKVPEMNGFYKEDAFVPSKAVHLGVAISLRSGGVVAPAIHDTDHMSLDELMVGLRDLVGRARAGVLRSSEMSDSTITVTNLGDLGVESVFGVIYPPQVALVGFGAVIEQPVARNGLVGARPCVVATLSGDHRVSDGHRGGRFLAEINRLLQEPSKL